MKGPQVAGADNITFMAAHGTVDDLTLLGRITIITINISGFSQRLLELQRCYDGTAYAQK